MRVISEDSLQMSAKDENGVHHVKDRHCAGDAKSCFSFDCNGVKQGGCSYFNQLFTGVKICKKPQRLVNS